jgi:hypothetical protein
MGVLDKLLDVVKLNDEYEEDDFLDEGLLDENDEDFLDDEDDEEKPVKKFFQKFGKKKEENDKKQGLQEYVKYICNYSGIPLGCHIFFIFPLFLFYIF